MPLLVIYKKKLWKVLCPKDLKFEPNCIRNVLIERGNKREITHIKRLKPRAIKVKSLDSFFN